MTRSTYLNNNKVIQIVPRFDPSPSSHQTWNPVIALHSKVSTWNLQRGRVWTSKDCQDVQKYGYDHTVHIIKDISTAVIRS